MLKIAFTDLPEEQRWSLQGCLAGDWATELMSTWKENQLAGEARRRIVDLIEVTSIDRNGEAVLAEMMSQRAEFISGDVYIEHLLRNLRSELERTRMKERQNGGDNHR
jgi:hypothetical protein